MIINHNSYIDTTIEKGWEREKARACSIDIEFVAINYQQITVINYLWCHKSINIDQCFKLKLTNMPYNKFLALYFILSKRNIYCKIAPYIYNIRNRIKFSFRFGHFLIFLLMNGVVHLVLYSKRRWFIFIGVYCPLFVRITPTDPDQIRNTFQQIYKNWFTGCFSLRLHHKYKRDSVVK